MGHVVVPWDLIKLLSSARSPTALAPGPHAAGLRYLQAEQASNILTDVKESSSERGHQSPPVYENAPSFETGGPFPFPSPM